MFISKYFQTFILSILFLNIPSLVEAQIHKYDVKEGMIIYAISGMTQLTQETNLSIDGSARLRFREWGDIQLEEENGIVLTYGAIKHKQSIHRLEKETHDCIITVDYENEQLLERKKNNTVSSLNTARKGLLRTGHEMIAGYICTIWIGPGIEKCIYKGVVLKQQSEVMGVRYKKEAIEVVFDINISETSCNIPNFPIHKFGLYKDKIKTYNSIKVENFCEILKETSFELTEEEMRFTKVNLDDKIRQKFINNIGKDIFKRQKKLLPQLLNSLKETRVCIHTVENPFAANQCIEKFSRMKDQLGTQEDDYIILWNSKRKYTLLDKIEDELIYLQSRIACVNRSKNITDLSKCMK